ncbi:MAG: CbtA family protein [Actinomycetota bacterium]
MSARALLVRGLAAGLVAGLVTFVVAYVVGGPQVEAAISLEETGGGGDVSRALQRTWGLLTATVTVGLALGGAVALVVAGTLGRLGRLLPGQSTALVTLLGFVSFALVPFLKYPANPPAVGDGATIGHRTALYFGFVLVSVVAAVLATRGALRVRERVGTYGGVVAGVTGYLLVVVLAGQVLTPAAGVGDFPADTLWSFRLASLVTLATLWGVIGLVLTGLVSRLYADATAQDVRRDTAASL